MIAHKLADFIKNTGYEELPDNIVAMARNCIIDWLGCAIVGSRFDPAQKASSLIKDMAGNEASLIGTNKRAALQTAALYNGMASHSVALDDLHRRTILHPGTVIISAAWPAAEAAGISGKELITAVTLGYEVAIRTAEAVSPSHYKYWYATGTCGIFGAAAAVSRIMGLEPGQIVSALGNAGVMSAGLWEFQRDKVDSRQLIAGKAAADGMTAAMLARLDFSGAGSIFEGEQGFLKAYSREPRPALLEQGLGEEYKIKEITFKLYPSGRHTHGGIDLALRLRDRGIKPQDIELIRIKTYKRARELVGNPDPYCQLEAKYSLPFCVATTLLYGHPTLQCFCLERIEDKELRRVMSHVTVEVDPEIDLLYPDHWPTVIETIDRHSHIVRERTDYPKGDPENPAATVELHNKFLALASSVLGEERAEKLLASLVELAEVDNLRTILTAAPGDQ